MDMTDVQIHDFDHLDRLALRMDQVGDQAARLGDYVGTWVCQRGAFETSRLCLLQPLAPAVDAVAHAFDEFVRGFGADWRGLADAVVTTRRAFADVDDQAAAALEGMLP